MNQPRQTIIFSRASVDSDQRNRLAELFAHPGYALLKGIIGAHATERQAQAMNAGLYALMSDDAAADTKSAIRKAAEYSKTLDILEEIEAKDTEWFTAKLEPRP
jgi:hypothetical protein